MNSSSSAVAIAAVPPKTRTHPKYWFLRSEHVALWTSIVYFAAMSASVPSYASAGHGLSLFSALLPLLILAAGQTLVLIAGGIDLSVTAIVGLTSVVGAAAMNEQNGWFSHSSWATPIAIGLMLLTGVGAGMLNGFVVTRLKIPATLATLSTMLLLGTLASAISHSKAIIDLPASFTAPMNDIVVTGTITILMITLLHFALGRTLYGRWLYACGQNASASALEGVPVASVQTRAYAASGYCAAVAAIFYTASSGRGMADHGHELMLDILVAVLISGASLRGGKGKLTWTLSAVVFVILLNDTLKSLGIAGPFLMIIKGALVGVAAVLDAVRNRS